MNRTAALAAAIVFASGAQAQVVTVTTLEDVTDFTGARQVADLPGPDGVVSFREAITATNNTPEGQTIEFAIPRDEWWFDDNMAVLKLEIGAFNITDDQTIIDFASQAKFTGDTNPNGNEVGIYGLQGNGWGTPAIFLNADDCEIRGLGNVWLRGSAVAIWNGNRNRIVGCVTNGIEIDPYPDHCSFNVIGGTNPEDRNILEWVEMVCGADDNVVVGNVIETIFVGASPYCDTSSRNRIGGPSPAERNIINGFGRYGEEGFPEGEGIEVSWATDTLIEGNYIGVNEAGTARVSQIGPTGVEVNDSVNTTIRGNLIAGLWVQGRNHYQGQLFGQAIRINAINRDNLGTVVENNLIGTDATGTRQIRTLNGVLVSPFTSRYLPRGARIGGVEPGQGNTIRFVERTGVYVGPFIDDGVISGNSISYSGSLAIDLIPIGGDLGVTPNDLGDVDTNGGNELQNFPVLQAAETDGGGVNVVGMLNSHANRAYRVEFFANEACDPSGHGEAERFLGYADVTTDGLGDAGFESRVLGSVGAGEFVTATATDLVAGTTSELSACVVVGQGGCAADLDGDGDADADDFFAYLDLFAARDGAADLDGDGDTDADDFFAYLDLFSVGC